MIEPKSIVTCEDCMDLMARYPDKYFDLAIVDPPYGIGEDGKKNNGRGNLTNSTQYADKRWDRQRPSESYWTELRRVSINQVVWGANHFGYMPPSPCWIVWDKQHMGQDFADCELAWTSFTTATRKFTFLWAGMWQGDMKNKEERIHPTQKPVKLYDWLLGNYAEGCKTILDTHLGSGSSRIAAHKAGFDFVGCEIDKDYFAAQEKRFQDYLKQLKLDFLYSQKEGK